jgi:hypothetical protein
VGVGEGGGVAFRFMGELLKSIKENSKRNYFKKVGFV